MTKEEFQVIVNNKETTQAALDAIWNGVEGSETLREYYLSTSIVQNTQGLISSLSRVKKVFKLDDEYFEQECTYHDLTDQYFGFTLPKTITKEKAMRVLMNKKLKRKEPEDGAEPLGNSETEI